MKDQAYWDNKHPYTLQTYEGRPLPASKKTFDMDVRHFVWDRDAVLQRFIEREKLQKPTIDETVVAIQKWVVDNIEYTSDKTLGVPEYWLFPAETLALKKGDCEDGAILIASLILHCIPPQHAWRVRIAAGWVTSGEGAAQGGHGYACFARKEPSGDFEWCPIDWCYREDSDVPLADKVLTKNNEHYKDVWFSFNHLKAYSHLRFNMKGRVTKNDEDEDDGLGDLVGMHNGNCQRMQYR